MNKITISISLAILGFVTGCSSNPSGPDTSTQSSVTKDQIEQRRVMLIVERSSGEPYTGTVTDYYRDGTKEMSFSVNDGLLVGPMVKWYSHGQKEGEATLDGNKSGHVTEWYENGQMKSDSDMYRGRPTGMTATWYKNGQMKSESNHLLEGRPKTGVSITWFENGQMKSEETFVDGRSQSTSTWDENGTNTTLQAEAKEGLNIARGAKAAVTEYYQDRGEFPIDNQNAGLADGSQITGKYVTSVMVKDGVITVSLGRDSAAVFAGHALILTPTEDRGSVSWQCSSPDIDEAYLPPTCK